MHWFTFLILAMFIACGYYVYRRLAAIEREIRAEQKAMATAAAKEEVPAAPTSAVKPPPVAVVREPSDLVLETVAENPGLKQTELYDLLPDLDRRELQKLLRDLEQQGRLRREKKGSSYRLHPL